MAKVILLYAVVVKTLTFVLRAVAADKAAAFFVALTGGALSLSCGVAAWMGHTRRVWVVLTSTLSARFLLTLVVSDWTSPWADGVIAGRTVLTLMLLLTFGLLLYSVHGERPSDFFNPEAAASTNVGGSNPFRAGEKRSRRESPEK